MSRPRLDLLYCAPLTARSPIVAARIERPPIVNLPRLQDERFRPELAPMENHNLGFTVVLKHHGQRAPMLRQPPLDIARLSDIAKAPRPRPVEQVN